MRFIEQLGDPRQYFYDFWRDWKTWRSVADFVASRRSEIGFIKSFMAEKAD